MRPSPEIGQLIADKKARYTRLIDTQDWPQLEDLLPQDFTFKSVDQQGNVSKVETGEEINFSNRDQFKAHCINLLHNQQSIHITSFPELDQVGPDEIRAIFTLVTHAADMGPTPAVHGTIAGHYHDVFKRRGDDWYLAEVVLKQTYFVYKFS